MAVYVSMCREDCCMQFKEAELILFMKNFSQPRLFLGLTTALLFCRITSYTMLLAVPDVALFTICHPRMSHVMSHSALFYSHSVELVVNRFMRSLETEGHKIVFSTVHLSSSVWTFKFLKKTKPSNYPPLQ